MTSKSEFELSLSKCYRALQLILDKRSLAIPRNYDVWYNYVSGELTSLVAAIDAHLAEHDSLTQEDIDHIYERFICPVGKMAASEEIGTRICSEVTGISDKLAFATSKTRQYRAALSTASQRIGPETEPDQIRTVLTTMIASTREMEKHSVHLELSLEAAQLQVTELNRALSALQVETKTDALTGLANRKKFDHDLQAAIAEAEVSGAELCMLLGDVDNFKKFNDMYGHQTGDAVLKQTALALGSTTKNRELVARYGGEEFALILPKTNLQGAVGTADRIRSALAASRISDPRDGSKIPPITMSFGAARHHEGETVQDFVARADTCLYAAKKAGRNCVRTETEVGLHHNSAVA